MNKPCGHAETVEGCRICFWASDPTPSGAAYRERWGLAKLPTKTINTQCQFFGAATGEIVQCPTCQGSVKLKLFACEIHSNCTPSKKIEGTACCVGCPDYSVKESDP